MPDPVNAEDDLVEIAARALYEHWVSENLEDDWAGWDRLGDKQTWRDRASAALEAVRSTRDGEIERLRDEIVTLWHKTGPEETRELHEALGMTWHEYREWVGPRQALNQGTPNVG